MEEELLPPPPKKQASQEIVDEGELLPPPPKKKNLEGASPAQPTSGSQTASKQQLKSGESGDFLAEANKAFKDGGQFGLEQGLTEGQVIGKPVQEFDPKKQNEEFFVKQTEKLKKDIGKTIESSTYAQKQLSLKTKIANYLERLVGGKNLAETDGLLGGQVDVPDMEIDVYEPIRLDSESLQPTSVSENIDPEKRKEIILNNSKQYKEAVKTFEEIKPYIGNIKTYNQAKEALDKYKYDQSLLSEKIENDRKTIDAKIKEAQNLNPVRMQELGFVEGFEKGIAQTTVANTIADTYMSGKTDETKTMLENLYVDMMMYPQQSTTSGMVGELMGGQAKPMGVAVGLGAVNPVLGAVGGAAYYGRTGLGSEMISAYVQARQQGIDGNDAFNLATKQGKVGAITGAAEGLVSMGLGSMVSKTFATGGKFAKAVKETLASAGVDAGVAGSMQKVLNENARSLGLDVEEDAGIIENMTAEGTMQIAQTLLMFGGRKVLGANYGEVLNGVSKAPFQDIQATVNQAVQSGALDAARGGQLLQEIQKTKAAQEKLKGVQINEKVEASVVEKQVKVDELTKELETASEVVKPEIQAEIDKLNGDMQVEAAIRLSPEEKSELNKLQVARDENKTYDKDRLKLLEKRQKAADKVAEEKKAEEEAIKRQQEEEAAKVDGKETQDVKRLEIG